MRKTASLLAFVIFSILNGIAQTNPYDLVGDTILFYNQATSLLDNRKKQESEVISVKTRPLPYATGHPAVG